MNDYADKSYLQAPLPDTLEARQEHRRRQMGRNTLAHPRSTFVYQQGPTVLNAWTHKREIARGKK